MVDRRVLVIGIVLGSKDDGCNCTAGKPLTCKGSNRLPRSRSAPDPAKSIVVVESELAPAAADSAVGSQCPPRETNRPPSPMPDTLGL